jgi:glycosyltransferase involved in cell wall biosynthesis
MATLTVFTPAYNRAHTIWRTYESLCRQTCKDFEWLVIDDGSTDNTRELLEGWISDGKISIRYIYQQNQGMHGAHNTAYKNIDTPLNTCIDSDDYMPDDAVEKILACWREHGSEKFAGLIGLDVTEDGEVIGTKIPQEMATTTLQGFYAAGGKGDKKLVYRTDVIKRYPEYPLFEGERYVGLAYKYMLIDQDYELVTLNEPLVIVEYQQDGSSFNMFKQYWNNPKGFAFFRKAEMMTTHSLKRKLRVCTHYVSSSIISKNSKFIQESPEKLLTILCIPAGVVLYWLIRHKVKHHAKMAINKSSVK